MSDDDEPTRSQANASENTAPLSPTKPMDGLASPARRSPMASLFPQAQAGLPESSPSTKELIAPIQRHRFEERYAKTKILGRGGMGEVWLYRDEHIGRQVAVKSIVPSLQTSETHLARFLREARIQGQLEHPSIVPVHELSVDDQGSVYFTMKRVRGMTLHKILADRIRKEPRLPPAYQLSTRRLLTAFSQACLAVDFAHQHGVIHRDLKPANIMLGDYGEVYVLDWGIARLTEDAGEDSYLPPTTTLNGNTGPITPTDDHRITEPDLALGTPGYMPPEQIEHDHIFLTPAADVYALGAILFEILTGQRLHNSPQRHEVIQSTLNGNEARPSERAPERDISPELDALVAAATARDVELRLSRARDLAERLEQYLDGERDLDLRRKAAATHADRAATLAAEMSRSPDGDLEARRGALREVGRALALDPEHAGAVNTMMSLLRTPPDVVPETVSEQLTDSENKQNRFNARVASIGYFSLLLYLPLIIWATIRNVPAIAGMYACFLLSAAGSYYVSKAARSPTRASIFVLITSNLGFASTTVLFGPLVVVPTLVAVNTLAFAMHFRGWGRAFAILVGLLAILGPIGLELAGVTNAYEFTDGMLIVHPVAIGLSASSTLVLLAVASVATVITATLSVSALRDALRRSEEKLYLHGWQLEQFASAAGATNARDDSDAQ